MSKFVTIVIDGEVSTHMPHTTGDYATMCGLDGDDEHIHVNQKWINTPPNAKINCKDCFLIWKMAIQYSLADFSPEVIS